MMGAESVGYHEHAVLGRGDDPVANALDYYASRGETPMAWGGAGARFLGLSGEVDLDEWRAVFSTGGPRHPCTGGRLVACTRPGMELVVSPPLCRCRDKWAYAEDVIMPRSGGMAWTRPAQDLIVSVRARHNHRLSRKATSVSGGR